MKWIFILLLGLIIIVQPAFGVLLGEKTGLKFSSSVNVDGTVFVIEGTGNFDVKDISFDQQNNALVFIIESSLEYNLMEIIIPNELIGEQILFLVDGVQVEGNLKSGTTTTFATLEFTGVGTHNLTISDSEYEIVQPTYYTLDEMAEDAVEPNGGGCLIATAAFGSEMAPQVQLLRELRDNTVLQTQYGSAFMAGFNEFYYSFSPVVADYERENPMLKETVKVTLTPLLTSLAILNYVDIDTEQEMLGYGIGVILLNIGMYFVAPAVLVISVKKRLFLRK
jgi:hypothetical protein|tara:strand:+ start:939 stop:1778 length:840 start_codon:yes stop_codon:yes gene_type:complete